jgi:hypothetical protein
MLRIAESAFGDSTRAITHNDCINLAPYSLIRLYPLPRFILTRAVYKAFPNQQVVGLCHNIQNLMQAVPSLFLLPIGANTCIVSAPPQNFKTLGWKPTGEFILEMPNRKVGSTLTIKTFFA